MEDPGGGYRWRIHVEDPGEDLIFISFVGSDSRR